MGISPVAAVPKILEQVGLTKEDIDVFEVRIAVSGLTLVSERPRSGQ